jgi:hypothetical protein
VEQLCFIFSDPAIPQHFWLDLSMKKDRDGAIPIGFSQFEFRADCVIFTIPYIVRHSDFHQK